MQLELLPAVRLLLVIVRDGQQKINEIRLHLDRQTELLYETPTPKTVLWAVHRHRQLKPASEHTSKPKYSSRCAAVACCKSGWTSASSTCCARPFYTRWCDFEYERLPRMEDNTNNSKLVNTARGVEISSRRVPSEFKDWQKQHCLVLSINHRDAYAIMQGQSRPTPVTGALLGPNIFLYTGEQQEEYDKECHDLCGIRLVWTRKPAYMILPKHEATTVTSRDGQKATHELYNKYLTVT